MRWHHSGAICLSRSVNYARIWRRFKKNKGQPKVARKPPELSAMKPYSAQKSLRQMPQIRIEAAEWQASKALQELEAMQNFHGIHS